MSAAALLETLHALPGRHVPAGGIDLFVADQGEGPALVFLHGLGWSHALWRPQLARLAPRYRCIAGDNRGHGRSDRPAGPYSIEDMARDWLAALDEMKIESWCLIGFSQGSCIAQLLAALAPSRTRALVLAGAGCHVASGVTALMEARLQAASADPVAGAIAAAQSVFSPDFRAAEPEFIAEFVRLRAQHEAAPLAAATRALFDFDARPVLGQITCPVLVMAGERDLLCAAEAAEELAARLRGDCVIFPRAGHMLTLEQPERFNTLLDSFLARRYPGGAP